MSENELMVIEDIQRRISAIRGVQVMLDEDLAECYGVETKQLNEQVRRNRERFPNKFMFQLSWEEYDLFRSQIATIDGGRGKHRKYLPYAFTEQGVGAVEMLAKLEAVRHA